MPTPVFLALGVAWPAAVLSYYLPHSSYLALLGSLPNVVMHGEPMSLLPVRAAEILISLALIALLDLSCLAMGRRAAALLGNAGRRAGGTARLLLGLGIFATAWLGFGLAGLWFRPAAWGLLAVPLFLMAGEIRGSVRALAARARAAAAGERGWLLLAAVPLAVSFAGAVAPETAFDPLRYHLGLSQGYIAVHRCLGGDGSIFGSFPANAGTLFGWFKLADGDGSAKLFNWSLLPLLALLTSRLAGGGAAGRWAALALLAIPTVLIHSSNAFAELLLAVFAAQALAVLLDGGGGRSAAALSGAFAGLALGTKYQGLHSAIPLGIGWLAAAWPGRRSAAARHAFLFTAAALAVFTVWLARNWLFTGNPVHPVMAGEFPRGYVGGEILGRSRFSLPGLLGQTPLAVLAAPWRALVSGDASASYPFGPALAALLPLLLFPAGARCRMLGMFAGGVFLAWLATTSGWGRYLISAFPAACAGGMANAASIWPAQSRPVRLAAGTLWASAVLAGMLAGICAVNRLQDPMPFLLGQEDRHEYLSRVTPGNYRIMLETSRVIGADGRYYSYGEQVTYYSGPRGTADYESAPPLAKILVEASFNPADLRRKYRQLGLGWLVYRPSGAITLSYVAPMRRWTGREIAVYQGFFREFAEIAVHQDDGRPETVFYVYRLRARPDPAARFPRGALWAHLPGTENLLGEGDYRYSAGKTGEALALYRAVAREYPDYILAWQRIADSGSSGAELALAKRRLKQLGW